jgi:hypothetical protein
VVWLACEFPGTLRGKTWTAAEDWVDRFAFLFRPWNRFGHVIFWNKGNDMYIQRYNIE